MLPKSGKTAIPNCFITLASMLIKSSKFKSNFSNAFIGKFRELFCSYNIKPIVLVRVFLIHNPPVCTRLIKLGILLVH